jgi:hypothetical protein
MRHNILPLHSFFQNFIGISTQNQQMQFTDSISFSDILNSRSFLRIRDQVSYPYRTTGKLTAYTYFFKVEDTIKNKTLVLLYYLACTNPIAISVAADLMERATLVRYCLNSVAHD